MASNSVIEFTTGVPGAGKTLLRGPRFLVEQFFRDDPKGSSLVICNLPLNVDAIAEECERRYGVPAAQIAQRIVFIPEEELEAWREFARSDPRQTAEGPGPWSFFEKADLTGCRLQIDELHHYCGMYSNVHCRRSWNRFLAEARHMGVTIEGLTQDAEKVADEFKMEAAVNRNITHSGTRRDPLFKILYSDYYELWAKLRGKYKAATVIVERRKADGKWRTTFAEKVVLDPKYFPLYNSFAAPQAGGRGAITPRYEFEKRSWPGLLAWFLLKNLDQLGWRLAVACVFLWATLGHVVGLGGAVGVFGQIQGAFLSRVKSRGEKTPGSSTPATSAASSATKKEAAAVSPEQFELQELRKVGKELESLRKQRELETSLAMILPDKILLQGGYVYGRGEAILHGPLTGDIVDVIDMGRKFALCRSGRVLRFAPVAGAPYSGSPGATLASTPGASGGTGRGGSNRATGLRSAYAVRELPPDGDVLPSGRGSDAMQHHHRGEARSVVGDDDRHESAARPSTLNAWPQIRR